MGEGEAGAVVDSNVKVFPSGAPTIALPSAISADPMADAVDTAEFLDVDVDEFTRQLTLITDDRRSGIKCREAPKSAAAQHDAHGGDRPGKVPGDGWRAHALAAQGQDLRFRLHTDPGRAMVRSRRAIRQSGLARGGKSVTPFAHRPRIDTLRRSHTRHRPTSLQPLHHQKSTVRCRSGILMDVHPGLHAEICVCGSHSLHIQPRKDNLHSSDI